MKISIDRDADVLHVAWGKGGGSAREVEPGIYVTYDQRDRPVGLEVLGFSSRTTLLEQLNVSYAPPGNSKSDPPTAQEFTIEFPSAVAL